MLTNCVDTGEQIGISATSAIKIVVINFNFAERLTDEDIEKYKECSFEAMIYDNYIE